MESTHFSLMMVLLVLLLGFTGRWSIGPAWGGNERELEDEPYEELTARLHNVEEGLGMEEPVTAYLTRNESAPTQLPSNDFRFLSSSRSHQVHSRIKEIPLSPERTESPFNRNCNPDPSYIGVVPARFHQGREHPRPVIKHLDSWSFCMRWFSLSEDDYFRPSGSSTFIPGFGWGTSPVFGCLGSRFILRNW